MNCRYYLPPRRSSPRIGGPAHDTRGVRDEDMTGIQGLRARRGFAEGSYVELKRSGCGGEAEEKRRITSET